MPHRDQRIVNPITGERIVFRRTTRETDGECLLFDVELRPGGVIAGAPHHHPHEERFHVTQGRLAGWIAGQGPLSKVTGERFTVPSGVDHFICNGALGITRATVEARPGGEFDRLLETAFALSHGRLGVAGELARLMHDQRVMVSLVPDAVQERLLSALSSAAPHAPAA
jgi:quercetin dioxygenase-like cupin family protein